MSQGRRSACLGFALRAGRGGREPIAEIVAAIPQGPLALRVRDEFHLDSGNKLRKGNLELRYLPFMPQVEYDELLWACDINFVRGEDTFVRAQWAGRPFVWHIYPQQDDAHRIKLNAFLDIYLGSLPTPAVPAVRGLWRAWNGVDGAPQVADAWLAFCSELQAQRQGLRRWQESVARIGDLTGNLVKLSLKMI